MSASFCGWGTALYGKRDFRKDGSYITTEWVILAFIPTIPLKSLRVTPLGTDSSVGLWLGVSWESKYKVSEVLTVDRKQMFLTYAFVAILTLAFWPCHTSEKGSTDEMMFGIIFLAICCIPKIVRTYARRKLAKQSESSIPSN